MRKVLLAFIFYAGCLTSIKANDTLTRREIYNFEIGDTFDYKTVEDYAYYGIYNVGYSRNVVNDKVVSANADTFIYVINGGNLILTQLDSVEIILQCPPDTLVSCNYSFGSISGTNIPKNTIDINGLPSISYSYGKGLGKIYDGKSGYDMGFRTEYTELIYFSKDTIKWGTPYYLLSDIKGLGIPPTDFRIYPNRTAGDVTVSIDESLIGSTAIISDITGRTIIAGVELKTLNTKLETAGWSNGVYFVTLSNGFGNGTKRFIVNR